MNRITLKNISFSYSKEEPVIKHVSFNIREGSYTSIIGHNGSGKSTLGRLIIGLLAPNDGEIYIDEELLTHKNVRQLRKKSKKKIFFMFITGSKSRERLSLWFI